MGRYAKNTSVPVEKSRAEIEQTLARYGADQFGYAQDSLRGMASVQFRADGRHIRFLLQLPSQADDAFGRTPSGRQRRRDEDRIKAWEQACRQRWRSLALCIKAKLESVESGITDFEQEFMANIVLPGGSTVGEFMRPQIEQAYVTGDTPPGIAGLLPSPEKAESSKH